MATTYATRTFGTPTSPYKFTISFWVKRSKLSVSHIAPFTAGTYMSTNMGQFLFSGDDTLLCQTYNAAGSVTMAQDTNMTFTDVNGWYNIVLGVDGTLASAGDRQKLYVNGELITSLAADTDASQDTDLAWNQNGIVCMLGNRAGISYYFDGYLSHVHFIDGTQYAASDFGSTDATTGQWKINTAPSVTYGNNGFFVLKNGNSLTDQSGNSNDFTLGGGAILDMKDCPSDVYATNNPLVKQQTSYAMQYCNTWCRTSDAAMFCASSTLGIEAGKFYAEVKCGTIEASAKGQLGISGDVGKMSNTNDYPGGASDSYSYASDGAKMSEGSETGGYGDSWTTGDIISIAYDADNNKLYFAKNGVWQDSGDPTSGSTGTGAISIEAPSNTVDGAFFFACGDNATSGSTTTEYNWNYGNGYFGATAISSEGTNASGIGKFEYDVPAGYTALSTKGLNE